MNWKDDLTKLLKAHGEVEHYPCYYLEDFISQTIAKEKAALLTKPELDQLVLYVREREREGWYYGNKKHFEKRHISIKEKLQALAEERSEDREGKDK